MSSFQARFRVLARERLVVIRAHLAALGRGDDVAERGAELRREVHTMKGEARIVGEGDVANALHEVEEALAAAGEGALSGEQVASLLARLDAIEVAVDDDAPRGEGGDDWAERLARSAGGAVLRVDVGAVSRIARTVGELRIGESDLQRAIEGLSDIADAIRTRGDDATARARAAADLRRLVVAMRQLAFDQHVRIDQLVSHVREVRMVPLGTLFERFPRAAQQLARELGKELRVEVRGADVQVDRQVLDVIAEPMLHLVRNAVDHGLEPPDVRRDHGKNREGTLELDASTEGSLVRIEVRDDGRGVDVLALQAALRERGIGAAEDVTTLDDEEILERLCRRGLSTRRTVSDVSGRGVGLDVVKRRVESVGGRLGLRTIAGAGATFSIEVPMSALLAPMLCAMADDARYALAPQDVERLEEMVASSVETVGRGLALRVDGAPVPLFDLATLLGRARRDPRERSSALVIAHGGRRVAVAVDRVVGTLPVLQHRLDPFLEGATLVRSVALLANGELAVALDVGELFRRADAGRAIAGAADSERARARSKRVLVADDSELTRDVVVSILREMQLEVIEAVDGRSALELIASSKPDLVLTDLDMPVVDGFELLRRVRAEPAWSSLPVIVLSTRWAPADLQRASELGADAYLVKNRIELDEVRRVVGAHLATPRREGERS
ncbi:hybrid sensor histidine kinase/response regulator [Sandaracinus amylolyticus]|uniref:histidine kinase n=1 Tax=Sandaracinus amylolyticus TaxID=927083 RepID=A0A0F6W4N7_9BACT|nr:response regulator [Sandaracinus amylolyticus]AKF07305.1 Signal transduction histidine kinase CheA [Sandaracinus amylolyticus]